MKITEVTVSYGLTHNLGNYSNVRPELRMTATVEEGEDPDAVRVALSADLRRHVEELVDQALERDGQRAHYSREPRFQVVRTQETNFWGEGRRPAPELLVVIVPNSAELKGKHVAYIHGIERKIRLGHARWAAADYVAEHPEYTVVEALDDQAVAALPAWLFREPEPEPAPAMAVTEADDDELFTGDQEDTE